MYSLIALHLLGYDLDHPVMRAGLESLDRFAVWREDGARMVEAAIRDRGLRWAIRAGANEIADAARSAAATA